MYVDELSNSLEIAKDFLEKKLLQDLRYEYSLQASAIHGMLELLINKRIVHSDPYSYDDNMSEVKLPEVTAFADNEKSIVIGERLSHYAHSIDFINTHYHFNCKYLTPKKVSLLNSLNQSFKWASFNDKAESPNTAGLFTIMKKSSNSTDKLTMDVLRNTIDQLAKSYEKIELVLEKLAVYHREGYKLFIRKTVFPLVTTGTLADGKDINEMFSAVKKVFAKKFSKKPFYQDLILETLKEDYSKDGAKLKENALLRLDFTQAETKKNIEKVDNRQFLISGLKILSGAGVHFETALEKILYNEKLISKQSAGFFSKVVYFFIKTFGLKPPEKEIIVSINDPITQSHKRETINLHSFKEAVENKIRVFKNILESSLQVNLKLQQIPEKTLFENFTGYISECNSLLDKMAGLDQYYKTIKPSLRSKIKGIKIEITTIKNSIINANQYRAEYLSRTEIKTQMQKLGIK